MTDSMEVLGWTLLHFCWQAAAIALVYRVVDFALPTKARSNLRYGLALVALLSMFGVSLATFAYEEDRAAADRMVYALQASAPGIAEKLRGELLSLPAVKGAGSLTQTGFNELDLAEYGRGPLDAVARCPGAHTAC